MDIFFNKIVAYFSLFTGGIYFLLGGDERIVKFLLYIMVIDFITGTLQAFFNGKLDSKKIYKGIVKKIAMLLIVSVSQQIEVTFVDYFDIGVPLRDVTVFYYIYLECISFTENIGKVITLPPIFIKVLKQLQDKGEQE